MQTFLLTWNQKKWPWETLTKDVARVQSRRVILKDELWSQASYFQSVTMISPNLGEALT